MYLEKVYPTEVPVTGHVHVSVNLSKRLNYLDNKIIIEIFQFFQLQKHTFNCDMLLLLIFELSLRNEPISTEFNLVNTFHGHPLYRLFLPVICENCFDS